MDPLSITASVTALATLCAQVAVLCNNAVGRYQSFRRTLVTLRTEIVAYQASLHHIQDLLLDQSGPLAEYLGKNNAWTASFDTALSACTVTISIIIGELQKAIASSSGNSNKFVDNVKYTLKEQEIKDLIGELRGQQSGVQLLVQTLQLKSTTEVLQLLGNKRDVFEDIKKQTDTLSVTWGFPYSSSEPQMGDSFSIFSLDPLDRSFDFDEEISKMGPYRRALRAQLETQRGSYQQPIGNLIDDDLLDFSIEPLAPGRWTEELQKEFSPSPTTYSEQNVPEPSDTVQEEGDLDSPDQVSQNVAGNSPPSSPAFVTSIPKTLQDESADITIASSQHGTNDVEIVADISSSSATISNLNPISNPTPETNSYNLAFVAKRAGYFELHNCHLVPGC